MDRTAATGAALRIIENLERVIVGKRFTLELAVACLLAEGHLLLQDVPGVGKTVLARALARSMGVTFKRIQCTPDLLPSDITGGPVYDPATGALRFVPGPVFAHVVLADELNRTTPRTQASLLEAMDERQVSADGTTYPLPRPFFVIGTLNPVEHHGAYPLPEGQLDRFLLTASLGYLTLEQEVEMVTRQARVHPLEDLAPVTGPDEVRALQDAVRAVHVDRSLTEYAVRIVATTREHPAVQLGSSPRGSLGLTRAGQAWAVLAGRSYVLPDDLKRLAPAVLAHRLIMRGAPGTALARGVVEEVLGQVPVPVA
ncbi:MAG: MoxR family ATPase [Armatimonadetes bacterium]|nr:MoxR family ATPase [Armatimonadota bacterium]